MSNAQEPIDAPTGASFQTLQVDKRQGWAIVRLNRPPVNAVNRVMRLELRACFEALSQDRAVNAVVLSATGKVFCGGVDLYDERGGATIDEADVRSVLDPGWEWRAAQHAIRHCLVPVIAAVDGKAIGAGFGLIGVSDIVIATDRAEFGLTEINVGLLGGASKALRMVGPAKARMMFFSGKLVSAAELYRLGAIEEVVEVGRAEEHACALASEFASKSPIGLRLAKESLLRIEGDEMEERYRTEQDYTARLKTYDDSKEAMRAFVEKRRPDWTWT